MAGGDSNVLEGLERCPECGSNRLVWDYEVSEVVCMDCGFVIDAKMVDEGPEWRAFDEEEWEKKARTGTPTKFVFHDKGLSTDIDKRNRDAYGKNVSAHQRDQIYRIRKWQRLARVADATERNLAFALSEVLKAATSLSLPSNIVETAAVVYRKALRKNLIRGRSMRGMSAAALYIACRQCGQVRTLEDVAKATNLGRNTVSRSFRIMAEELDFFLPSSKPMQHISKLSNHLEISGRVCGIANSILKAVGELKLTSGRSPRGIAASALYVASVLGGEKVTQREIALTAHITEVTIRNRYKEFSDRLFFTMTL